MARSDLMSSSTKFLYPHDYDHYYTPRSTIWPHDCNSPYLPLQIYPDADAVTLLSPPSAHCMNVAQPHFYVDSDASVRAQQQLTLAAAPYGSAFRQDSLVAGSAIDQLWPFDISMAVPALNRKQGLKRGRSAHQRTPSASTVASNGPASPYTQNYGNPQIANTDFAPNSPAAQSFADPAAAYFSKSLPTSTQIPGDLALRSSGYVPSQVTHPDSSAHSAMKGFAIDHNGEDIAPDFTHSPYPSMSSYGDNNSPATPLSCAVESMNNVQYSIPQNGEINGAKLADETDHLLFDDSDFRTGNSHPVRLFRTESEVFQDELYNPDITPTTNAARPASRPSNSHLSPYQNLVMSQRLQTANDVRTHSPEVRVARDRSPFRDGSPLAPANGWRSPTGALSTAASMRQHLKEQADRAELAQHQAQLQREVTKTISPKEAMLDYAEHDQQPLFQDTIPAGYKQHTGGTEQWPNNEFVSQPGAFASLQNEAHHRFPSFRATCADGFSEPVTFATSLPHEHVPIQNGSYLNSYLGPKMASSGDANPEFPAHLTSMESSISESGPQVSSQDSLQQTAAAQRPSDTRAATGTYSCHYHGCTQRFDTPANLQKHKREVHKSQQHHRETNGSTAGKGESTSPRSTESPAPSGADLSPSTIAARNSQAGPHKCNLVNPSTGKPCNTIFSRPYDLTRHEDTIHNNRKEKARCPMCREEKTFSRTDALTRHMRVVHPEVENFGKRARKGESF